jgi:hypothetical protein
MKSEREMPKDNKDERDSSAHKANPMNEKKQSGHESETADMQASRMGQPRTDRSDKQGQSQDMQRTERDQDRESEEEVTDPREFVKKDPKNYTEKSGRV